MTGSFWEQQGPRWHRWGLLKDKVLGGWALWGEAASERPGSEGNWALGGREVGCRSEWGWFGAETGSGYISI